METAVIRMILLVLAMGLMIIFAGPYSPYKQWKAKKQLDEKFNNYLKKWKK